MRVIILSISVFFMGISSLACSNDPAQSSKPMFKGVELYSWPDEANGAWFFTLCEGTNRNKTLIEIQQGCKRFDNVDELKKAMAAMAPGENVVWSSPFPELPLPAAEVVDDVSKAAVEYKIELSVSDPF
jgi:hypothetical protein